MSCGKCGCGGSKHLCPFSLGLAVGITCFIAIVVGAGGAMFYAPNGMPPMMMGAVLVQALWGLIRGFFFGFVLGLVYDFFACCMKGLCKKKNCSCGCCGGDKPCEPSAK